MAGRKQKRDASGRFRARTPTDRNNRNSSASSDDTSLDMEMCPIVPSRRCKSSGRRAMIIIDSSGDADDNGKRLRYQAPASGCCTKRQQATTFIKKERSISRVNSKGGKKRELSFQKVSEKLHVLNDKIDALSEKLHVLTMKIDALIEKLFRK
ncbi:hypothetical protein GUJ93_ZPchr0008g11865 [Zizania palustris]|uniref:Uncharacterized protein n=1 Tax=Zizania palustris TaxID=103762 RepID=A0A8J5UX73_ZIZPA|nr:hypothetical protein GUJ93_ZPchr0008g11865 [Zizania palustris]